MWRRFVISFLASFQFVSPNVFNLWLCGFIVIYSLIHVRTYPFRFKMANHMDSVCLLSLILILNCLFFGIENQNVFDSFITFFIMTPFVAFCLFGLRCFYFWMRSDENSLKKGYKFVKGISSSDASQSLLQINIYIS